MMYSVLLSMSRRLAASPPRISLRAFQDAMNGQSSALASSKILETRRSVKIPLKVTRYSAQTVSCKRMIFDRGGICRGRRHLSDICPTYSATPIRLRPISLAPKIYQFQSQRRQRGASLTCISCLTRAMNRPNRVEAHKKEVDSWMNDDSNTITQHCIQPPICDNSDIARRRSPAGNYKQ